MQSWNKTCAGPLLIALLILLGIPRGLAAVFIKSWQLKETAAAPVLVVGRVLRVRQMQRVPDGSLPWTAETLAMTAEIEVLRSRTSSGDPIGANRIQVHFLAYGPSVTMFINGYPPALPRFEPGQVLILPLQENRNPATEVSRLIADSGDDLIIPSRVEILDSGPPAPTARLFLIREIANTLSRGTPSEVAAVARYLAQQEENLTGEIMPFLESAIGADRQRWAVVATSVLAARGIPRPTIADLMSGTESKDRPLRGSLFLTRAALQKLRASAETDELLIKTWIAEAPWLAWGAANSLIEYADNSVTTETLRRALQDDLTGSSYIAWVLVRNGNRAILPVASARALKVADRPDADAADLQGAAALLRDYGTDQQLEQLAALIRKYQTKDEKFYRILWQYSH
jgi:hypothetical protein